jgi:hypothetical protein
MFAWQICRERGLTGVDTVASIEWIFHHHDKLYNYLLVTF